MSRWSTGSDANGAPNRFFVWDSSTDKFEHADLQKNWDTLHAIIGGSSTWPTTRGDAGGIFKEIANLSLDLVPLGTVISWWRPNSSVTLPTGWAPCDGRTVLAANHSYGGGDIVVPDLRNRFVLGAQSPDGASLPSNVTLGHPYTYPGDYTGASGSLGTATNSPSGAPSIFQSRGPTDGTAGNNAPVAHTHTIPHHYHIHSHTHRLSTTTSGPSNNNAFVASTNQQSVPGLNHTHSIDDMTSNARPNGSTTSQSTTQTHTSIPVWNKSGTAVAWDQTDPNNPQGGENVSSANAITTNATTLMSSNSTSVDSRPQYVGLLYLVKVKKNATT